MISAQSTGCARERYNNASIPTICQLQPVFLSRNNRNTATMNVQGKIPNEHSSDPTRSPSTPPGPTGGSSSSASSDENAGVSPPLQSVPVFWQEISEQDRQLQHQEFLAKIGLELAQEYVRVKRQRFHEHFLAGIGLELAQEYVEAIANELAQEEDRVDSAESLN